MGPVRKHACLELGRKELGLREAVLLYPKDPLRGGGQGGASPFPQSHRISIHFWKNLVLLAGSPTHRPPIPLDFESWLLFGREVTSYLLHSYTLCLFFCGHVLEWLGPGTCLPLTC